MKLINKIMDRVIYFVKTYRSLLLISLITLLCVELLNHPTLGVFDFITLGTGDAKNIEKTIDPNIIAVPRSG